MDWMLSVCFALKLYLLAFSTSIMEFASSDGLRTECIRLLLAPICRLQVVIPMPE